MTNSDQHCLPTVPSLTVFVGSVDDSDLVMQWVEAFEMGAAMDATMGTTLDEFQIGTLQTTTAIRSDPICRARAERTSSSSGNGIGGSADSWKHELLKNLKYQAKRVQLDIGGSPRVRRPPGIAFQLRRHKEVRRLLPDRTLMFDSNY